MFYSICLRFAGEYSVTAPAIEFIPHDLFFLSPMCVKRAYSKIECGLGLITNCSFLDDFSCGAYILMGSATLRLTLLFIIRGGTDCRGVSKKEFGAFVLISSA